MSLSTTTANVIRSPITYTSGVTQTSFCQYCSKESASRIIPVRKSVICSKCFQRLWQHIEQSGKLKEAEEWLLSQLALEAMP